MRRAFAFALSAGLLVACDSGLNARTNPDAPLAADAEFVTDSTGTLAASYAFNGSYRDGSGHGLDCTSQGVRFGTGRDRLLNTAAVFDGSAYLDCGDVLNDLQMPFSVTAWVWVEQNPALTYLVSTDGFSGDATTPVYQGAWLGLTDGRLGLDITNGGPAGPYSRRSRGLVGAFSSYSGDGRVQTPLVPRGRWVMVTGVAASLYDFRLYIDALNVGGSDTGEASTLVHSANRMRIGMNFKGRIDDLRIYRRALTEQQIERMAGVPSSHSLPR